ncbi:MAG: FkbM family methyltransferase [Paracoccus sp. (in: a-proteobacteria)]|uniref:FkbM family methyltransferase n=1 Tax=Paracoccus sp. TaxID=267 RepID=UPI0026E04936|nr:FkbM family methyltransferase [Paracoccus sp. (in: a-proteobacteria)]MDO5622375.1 FkbM family methyltransferase [Paracoccus sp. (in: a-proteobacteria)]
MTTETFAIDGATLEIPCDQLNDHLRERLESGVYERLERKLLAENLRPGDRVLDLGAGAGLVSIIAGRIVGPANLTSVEANPQMIRPLRRNLRRNLPAMPRVIAGAVVADDYAEKVVQLRMAEAFWASSVAQSGPEERMVDIPAKRFSRLLKTSGATVVSMDVEGIEKDLLTQPLPDTLRLVVAELHPRIYGQITFHRILSAMERSGWRILNERRGTEVLAFLRA